MQKAVVFGGAGFLGSHVADALTNEGWDVVVADRAPSPWLRHNQSGRVVDILDRSAVEDAVGDARVVFNFAGISDIGECHSDPVRTVEVNILGNANILEAARLHGVERYVFASSVYVYSGAGSFYRVSKQSAELQIAAYSEQFGLAYNILRYGSLYGPRSDQRNGIYRLLIQALRGGPVRYAGTGNEIRDYIHVFDAAALSVACLRDDLANTHLVLSGDVSVPVSRLLDMISEIFSVEIELTEPDDEEHYVGTPYTYRPQLARKFTSPLSVDLGQGLLDLAENIGIAAAGENPTATVASR